MAFSVLEDRVWIGTILQGNQCSLEILLLQAEEQCLTVFLDVHSLLNVKILIFTILTEFINHLPSI